MVKVIVGMMGSSVANGSSSMATPGQVQEFLSVVKSHGVKELDTARVYNGGKSEELLGEANAVKDFAISTKAPGFAPGSLTEANVLKASKLSHQALGQDKVDIYYIHGPDFKTPLAETCRAFGKLYKEGRFDRFGLSNLSDDQIQEIYDICKAEGHCLPTVYQGGYNPLYRRSETTMLPLLKKLGISFYAYSPLAGGLLAKPVDQIVNASEGRYKEMAVFGDLYLNDKMLEGVKKQTELCDRHGISIMEATMRWFMHHSPLGPEDGCIIGASKISQIEASLSATERGPLPDEVAKGFEELWQTVESAAPSAEPWKK